MQWTDVSRAHSEDAGFQTSEKSLCLLFFSQCRAGLEALLSPRPTSVSVHANRTIAKALNFNLRNARLGDCRCELLAGFDPVAQDVALHIMGEDHEHAGQSGAAGRAQVECSLSGTFSEASSCRVETRSRSERPQRSSRHTTIRSNSRRRAALSASPPWDLRPSQHPGFPRQFSNHA
jgi:hypothetical protein